MNRRPHHSILAVLLVVFLVAPMAFFSVPPKAHATLPVAVVGTVSIPFQIKTSIESTVSAIKNTITAIETTTSAIANTALQVDKYVLEPLAFVLSGQLLKSMTAGIIAFVDGQANGTGVPQFVQDLQGHLQNVGDIQAQTFLTQFNANSNSPFASAITVSLQNDYAQKTNLGGFLAKNQCTLTQASANPTAFLAGDWSQGGVGEWFALTTQNQNNPYMLYQSSQNEMASMVAGATAARLAELNWGQGFLSWCGDSTTNAGSAPSTAGASTGSGVVGSAGDPCTQTDGLPGIVKTPGSVIKASLDKALGTTFDKLVNMGNASAEINSIMGNIATVMSTVNFATQVLGGSGSGGLFGIGQTSSGQSGGSQLSQYQNSPSYLGTTQASVYNSAAALPASGSNMLSNIAQYQSAWNTINTAASSASNSLHDLINFCSSQPSGGYYGGYYGYGTYTSPSVIISDAQSALTNEIAPVFSQVNAAATTIAAAQAMVQKVQNELTAGANSASGAGGAYASDIQTLQSMSPTATDVANAQQQAQSFGTASANPQGSLFVSGGSLLDQMNLISSNAQALKSSCVPPPGYFNNNNS